MEIFPFSQYFGGEFDRPQDWLGDALNPHTIARHRAGVYLRHVILAMVKNFLDWADHEFSLNNPESLSQAGDHYRRAEEILQAPQLSNPCQDGLLALEFEIGRRFGLLGKDVFPGLDKLSGAAEAGRAIEKLVGFVQSGKSLRSIMNLGRTEIAKAMKGNGHVKFGDRLDQRQQVTEALEQNLFSAQPLRFTPPTPGQSVPIGTKGGTYDDSFGVNIAPVTVTLCIPPNPLLAAYNNHITIGLLALDQCRTISGELQPTTSIPPGALQDTVPTNLALVGSGIAGPLAVASDQPRYRYGYLLEQARQRAGLAKQLGDMLLGALKEYEQATYDLLLAQNARELAGATKDLKDLMSQEAKNAKAVADAQLVRAKNNQKFWNDRIKNNGPDGLSALEREALTDLQRSGYFQLAAAITNFTMALPAAIAAAAGAFSTATLVAATVASSGSAAPLTLPGIAGGTVLLGAAAAAGGSQIVGGLQGLGGWLSTAANEKLTQASFARRWEEWNLQNTLANDDATITGLQVTLAQDRVNISGKDYEIAGLQNTHAQRVYEFLQNKTLNKELYEWMVAVLVEQVRAVMQSAAAAAQLAQRALEFEWQAPITFIKGDYWTVDASSLREDQKKYGLLGAERLLTDLTRLDDFRLSVDKRRLHLAKTISLAQRFPADFVNLRRNGRIEFDTLIDWFDEGNPGEYLRLIKSSRVSVLGLVPPIDGIHGMLTNAGASTVTFPDRPPQRSLRTFGETIALDSPYNETGLFLLDYNDPMLLPFEGLGVETRWIFELPRAQNHFDFDTITDVLFTIEYTALHDAAYAARVRQRLGTSRSVNSLFSLRTNFPDQFYHLQNPVDATQDQIVTLDIPRTVFAPNLQNLVLKHLTVILTPKDPAGMPTLKNRLPQNGIRITVGGVGVDVDGSKIDANGSMTTMQPGQPGPNNPPFVDPIFDGRGVVPFGLWEVRIAPGFYTPDAGNVRPIDLVADILLVPTVEGNIH